MMMRFVPKVVDGESREFVVVPPVGKQFDETALQNRITDALHEAFPQAGFTIVGGYLSLREHEFTVIPVISQTSEGPATQMPREDVLAEIMAFLAVNFAATPAPTLH